MLEHPISSHMGIQLVQDAPFAHTRLHIQVTHDHWIHAWEPDHFMHDGTAHKHPVYSCMSTQLTLAWAPDDLMSATLDTRGRLQQGRELLCAGGSCLWSWCKCPWHPKRSPQCPITVIYKQAADTRETRRRRGARGVTRRETQQTRMKQAESPSKLESQTQWKQKAQLMLFRMWSNVQNSWAIWCTILLPRLRNTCVASGEHSSPHILHLEKALQLFESWTSWYLQQWWWSLLVLLSSSALYARV